MDGDVYQIRAARPAGHAVIAGLLLETRAALGFLPVDDPPALRRFVREVLLPQSRVSVALEGDRLAGFLALGAGTVAPSSVEQLWVRPDYQGRGLGSRLLGLAKVQSAGGLDLWVFEANRRAIAFYQRHGFQTVRQTDGADTMEKLPDRLMRWSAV
ncbi:MAG: GNAT family N-acetyltransferase [Alphaproteobacteria bacterium]